MIASENWVAPEDYKVYCFNGEPKYVMVCVGREKGGHPKFYYFDTNWTLARISQDSIAAPEDFYLEKPKCFDKMLDCSRKLAKPFPFVRADFYVAGEKLIFGELTFTPSGGLDSARLRTTDELMGSLVDLQYGIGSEQG